MAKWKLFSKTKETQTTDIEQTNSAQPIAEYSETLESDEEYINEQKETTQTRQKEWRDVQSIEKKIDTLHITKAEKPNTTLDRTVDRLLQKRKRKY